MNDNPFWLEMERNCHAELGVAYRGLSILERPCFSLRYVKNVVGGKWNSFWISSKDLVVELLIGS